jgi:hypothetical protein
MDGRRGEGVRRVSASRSSGDGAAETSRTTRAQNAQEAGAVAAEGEVASLRHAEVYRTLVPSFHLLFYFNM